MVRVLKVSKKKTKPKIVTSTRGTGIGGVTRFTYSGTNTSWASDRQRTGWRWGEDSIVQRDDVGCTIKGILMYESIMGRQKVVLTLKYNFTNKLVTDRRKKLDKWQGRGSRMVSRSCMHHELFINNLFISLHLKMKCSHYNFVSSIRIVLKNRLILCYDIHSIKFKKITTYKLLTRTY